MNQPQKPSHTSTTRRTALGILAAAAAAPLLAACGGGSSAADATVGKTVAEMAKLATAEKTLRLIAYPVTWANYAGHFAEFKKKYPGIEITVDNPDGSSADEIAAVKSLKGSSKQPDVLDIGYSFTDTMVSQKLVEAYKPTTYEKIPTDLRDAEGNWVAAYYGVLSIGYIKEAVPNPPKTLADLLKPEYKGMITLPGDPRKGAASLASVFAAAIAQGGSMDNVQAGIDFWAKLKASGNLIVTSTVVSGLTTGQAKIAIDWNFNFTGFRADLAKAGKTLEFVAPSDGVFGNFYAQPISIKPQHPNLARLWVEWLCSDEGAEQYALGGAVPARYKELADAGKLSKAALANMPDPAVIGSIKFPTKAQGEAATKLVVDQWGQKVSN